MPMSAGAATDRESLLDDPGLRFTTRLSNTSGARGSGRFRRSPHGWAQQNAVFLSKDRVKGYRVAGSCPKLGPFPPIRHLFLAIRQLCPRLSAMLAGQRKVLTAVDSERVELAASLKSLASSSYGV
jgi:hypothetical protein